MNNYLLDGRTLSVNIATIRGKDRDVNSTVDNSWKTAPPPRRDKNKDGTLNTKQRKNTDASNSKRSWTEWAGK